MPGETSCGSFAKCWLTKKEVSRKKGNLDMTADLHCHTTASDGTAAPAQLVRQAKDFGLKALGITDHDTVSGVQEALDEGKRLGIEIVPGLELNTDFEGVELHVLGYYPDLEAPALHEALARMRDARLSRLRAMLEKLAGLGIDIRVERVLQIAGEGSVGRPHVAQALQELGYAKDIRDAFDRYLGPGRPAYVSRYKLTPEQGIELVASVRGIAVLAHPGSAGRDELIPRLVQTGLRGIEVYHTNHDKEMERKYAGIAEEMGLIMTGGSDYHGPGRKEGIRLGDRTVSLTVVQELKELKEKMR